MTTIPQLAPLPQSPQPSFGPVRRRRKAGGAPLSVRPRFDRPTARDLAAIEVAGAAIDRAWAMVDPFADEAIDAVAALTLRLAAEDNRDLA